MLNFNGKFLFRSLGMKRICKLLTLLLAFALICTGCAGGAMRGNAFTVYTNPTDYQGVVFENGVVGVVGMCQIVSNCVVK